MIVYDLERTFLVLAFSMKGDPWSGLMKEIIRLKRGPLADNFKSVKGIRHLKHRYLIKRQFLEENELITSDFSFSRIFKFLVSLMRISLV